MKKIVIGSRGSKLALIQTEYVASEIRRMHPDMEVEIRRIITRGDREVNARLETIAGQGVFVKELEEALLDGRIDLAVHSLKDVTTEITPRLKLAAVTARIDPRDVLISRTGKQLEELSDGSKIGTSSLRRNLQLSINRPDLEICSIRGNIDTRIRKVTQGQYDAVILAASALIRLGLEEKINQYLPVERFLPAVGQGALAIELRSNDNNLIEIVSRLNHLPTWQNITAERAFLKALGGGCRAPIAALGMIKSRHLKLEGMVGSVKKSNILQSLEKGDVADAADIGVKLADKLLAMGGDEFIAEVQENETG